MASSLAQQLSKIAAHSTNSLNLKAQKASHSQSLIFEPRIAASQSFDTIYTLCHEGFQELCLLDNRFLEFQNDLFGEQSQRQDRSQLTAADNEELDKRSEQFLGLVGAWLRLTPAIKCVEWLIRRFRVHEHNTAFLLTTFLPYHTLPIFTTILSIIPKNVPRAYIFLHPYIRSLQNPPRHAIVYTATKNPTFTSTFNAYVLKVSHAGQSYSALLSFWAGIMTETVAVMLDKMKSGRKAVDYQNEQDIVLQWLPLLNEGLAMKKVPELRLGCYMLLATIVSKARLEDRVLTAMMEAVVLGWTADTVLPGLVCISILAQQRGAKQLSKRVNKELWKLEDLSEQLVALSKQRRVDKLVNGMCLAIIDRLVKAGEPSRLAFVAVAIENMLLSEAQASVVTKRLLLAAHQIDNTIDEAGKVKSRLAACLVKLCNLPGEPGFLVQDAIGKSGIDLDELELKLQTPLRQKLLEASTADVEMQDLKPEPTKNELVFSELFQQLPKRTVDEISFLSHKKSHIYSQLCQTFIVSALDANNLDTFDTAQILRKEDATKDALYFSFFAKIWCGPHPALARAAALKLTTRRLQKVARGETDLQALVPYVLVALGDVSTKVRKAAAETILALVEIYPEAAESKKKSKPLKQWAVDDIYGTGEYSQDVRWLSADETAKLLKEVVVPCLEECVLSNQHIGHVLESTLNSSHLSQPSPKKTDSTKLTQSFRASILSFLASHTLNTPVYNVKFRLLTYLNETGKIGGVSRTKVLLPVLQQWASLTEVEACAVCDDERINQESYDEQVVSTVATNDKEGLKYLARIIKGEVSNDRASLVAAVFGHIKKHWSSLKGDASLQIAQVLLEISQVEADEDTPASLARANAMDLLRSVPLSTEILISFVNQLPSATKLADSPQPVKRRRTSHGEEARLNPPSGKEVAASIQKVTFILQLVESSNLEHHQQLIPGLFNVLAELQIFKAQISSELGYLQNLVLSSLLAIMQSYKTRQEVKIERAAIREDVLVDCIQKSSSPQVQNSALLLIASLASTVPELILHSVMPIFTFMGNSVLRQNDEYSIHVIGQTIREVIPPLIASLRREKGNPVAGAATLLSSFVAAYEHVPTHRRKTLFISLVQTLGAEDFLFALLAMLTDRYGGSDGITAFATELSSNFSVETQLLTVSKYLDLIKDLLKSKPTIANTLLVGSDSEKADPQQSALKLLSLLPRLLAQKRLTAQTARLLQRDDMDASRIREIYSGLLESVLGLAESLKANKDLHSACGDVLESLLGLLSTKEFVKSVESLLDRPNADLRRKILRSLEVRIEQENQADVDSRVAMLAFLPQLTAIIRESKDIVYKHTAIACVDKIAEKYGKKDLEVVAAAAETIASDHCLGQTDTRLRVMSLLCLASLVEILREGIVPVLPLSIPKALQHMEESIKEDQPEPKLHNAGYAFISALVQYLPYMITGAYLDRLLLISSASAEAGLDDEEDEARVHCLQFAARQTDAKSMLSALEKNWDHARAAGELAVQEYIDILSITIQKHPKSTISRHADILTKILFSLFDLRRHWIIEANREVPDQVFETLEASINETALKMIYKLNDSTFRPLFSKLVEWATIPRKRNIKNKRERTLRLQTVYGFYIVFFDNLRSIVTSYATYILDSATELLQSVDPSDEESRELWIRVLHTLSKCFQHDQDDFWTSPSHFKAIAPVLNAQFLHASALPLIDELIPAVVELAAAADSPDHHKEINDGLLKHTRSENSSVRLAVVKCEQALTDKLGEEWLSMLPEMLPYISELQEDDSEVVERETQRWIVNIEGVLGESLDSMLQ